MFLSSGLYINNVLVDDRSGTFPYGRIGFRQSHDDAYGKTEIARYDNVRLHGAKGEVLFEAFALVTSALWLTAEHGSFASS